LFGEFWLEGELAILFADTGKGKSLLAVQIAESIARGRPIGPLEMTGRPQTVGDWLRVDLRASTPVRAVRVFTLTPLDWPRGLALEGSPDGASWRPLPARASSEGDLRWGGIALLRNGAEAVRLDFAPTVLRALRLTLTRGDPVYDWSVHDLTVYGD